jgi:hypothetical protein
MLDTSHLWPLAQLPSRLPLTPRGKKLHRSTGFRWSSRGVRGRKLKAVLVGGSLYTSDAWLRAFIEGKSEPAASSGNPADDSARQDRIFAAEAALKAMGI